MERSFALIENYIYLYHTDTFIILPVFPESVSDTNNAGFSPTTPIARSAPIYSYTGSGPREVRFDMKLHRDMMTQVNYTASNVTVEIGDDYVDTLVKQIQACALPNYQSAAKMVDPPMVAIKIGRDVFIKGVVIGGPSITYSGALVVNSYVENGVIKADWDSPPRYSEISISLTIAEIDPYGAEDVMQMGSFRGVSSTLENRLYGRSVIDQSVR